MRIPIIISDKIYIPEFSELKEFFSDLRAKFTYKNPEYGKKLRMGHWTGNTPQTIKTWEYATHNTYGPCFVLPRGGTKRLRETAEQYELKFNLLDQRNVLEPISGYTNEIELWDIQKPIAELSFDKQNCLIRAPTASGKTMVLLKITEWILQDAGPVLIIVWEGGLFQQWIDRIKECFEILPSQIGTIGGGKSTKIFPITVGMQQTLARHPEHIYKFGGILCDEVQRFAAPTFQDVISKCPAKYRIGASASERRKDNKEFLIYDAFGEIAGQAEKKELVIAGKIHEVHVRVVPTEFNLMVGNKSWQELESGDKNYNVLLNYMCNDEDRNNLIWEFLHPCLQTKKTIVVGTQRVSHARYWDTRICKTGFTSGLLLGGSSQSEEFESTVRSLRERALQVGVGTISKIAQGHDIPALDRGFIITPMASNIPLLDQFAGRLRRKAQNKKDAVLYYIWDKYLFPSHIKNLKNLFKTSIEIYVDGEFVPL